MAKLWRRDFIETCFFIPHSVTTIFMAFCVQEMETGTKYIEPTDYDIDFDYDDLSDI